MIILDNTPLLTWEVQGVFADLNMSSLVRTCVFCRPELTGKQGPTAKMKYIDIQSSKIR